MTSWLSLTATNSWAINMLIKSYAGDTVMAFKPFGKFSPEVRAKAIRALEQRGIHVWDQTFDPESDQVINICHAVEQGTLKPVPDRALYTFIGEQETSPRRRFDFGSQMF